MRSEKLKELRELLEYGNSGDHTRAAIALKHAIALIDAELAQPDEMAATIARLCSQACMLNMTANNEIVKREAAEAEARRLREAIERAPHESTCTGQIDVRVWPNEKKIICCTCWKREALATPAARECGYTWNGCAWDAACGTSLPDEDYDEDNPDPRVNFCFNCGLPVKVTP